MAIRVRFTTLATCGLLVGALTLAGCGRRGALEPAPDPSNPFALGTPKPPPDQTSRSGLPKRTKNPAIERPTEPFILDPLL